MKALLSIFSLLVLTSTCKSSKNVMDAKRFDQNSISGDYKVIEMDAKTSANTALKISFDPSSNKVTGFAGCNSFFGTYTLENNDISFGDIASSKKYCGKDQDRDEQHFFSILKAVNKVEAIDHTLVFSNGDTPVLKVEKMTGSKPNKAEQNQKANLVKEKTNTTLITYRMLSRGTFEYIQISKSAITTSKDRNLKLMETYPCQSEDWKALSALLNTIDIDRLDQLKAPTDKRLYDGAEHATLAIIKGDVEHMSPSFDHGSPPKDIEALVNKVLSVAESVTKQ